MTWLQECVQQRDGDYFWVCGLVACGFDIQQLLCSNNQCCCRRPLRILAGFSVCVLASAINRADPVLVCAPFFLMFLFHVTVSKHHECVLSGLSVPCVCRVECRHCPGFCKICCLATSCLRWLGGVGGGEAFVGCPGLFAAQLHHARCMCRGGKPWWALCAVARLSMGMAVLALQFLIWSMMVDVYSCSHTVLWSPAVARCSKVLVDNTADCTGGPCLGLRLMQGQWVLGMVCHGMCLWLALGGFLLCCGAELL